uniref:Uncharacterized protein n=1 Tax=Rhizophora mucronata TaxID=61149 RepID=A0A2P2Q856_RHIMU
MFLSSAILTTIHHSSIGHVLLYFNQKFLFWLGEWGLDLLHL